MIVITVIVVKLVMGTVGGHKDIFDYQCIITLVGGSCMCVGSCEWVESVADALFSKGRE